jgi:hypothetical protein
VLQVHLCFVYFIGGLAKSLGNGWWDGSNRWRSLIRPPFNPVPPDLLVQFKYALALLGISICLLEVSYPVFIWFEKDTPDLARLYFGDACCRRIDDGAVPLRSRHDCDEPGGIWRSQYGQESTRRLQQLPSNKDPHQSYRIRTR